MSLRQSCVRKATEQQLHCSHVTRSRTVTYSTGRCGAVHDEKSRCNSADGAHIQVYGGCYSSVLHQHHLPMACSNRQSVLNIQQTCTDSAALWTMQDIAPWLVSEGHQKQQQKLCGSKLLRSKMPNTHSRQAGPLCAMHIAGIVFARRT